MELSISSSIFIVLNQQNKPCGAGCVLELINGGKIAITNAHVVDQAGALPGDSIRLLFDRTKISRKLTARVLQEGYNQELDIAFISLPEESEGISLLSLWSPDDLYEHSFSVRIPVSEEGKPLKWGWVAGKITGEIHEMSTPPLLQLSVSPPASNIVDGTPVIYDEMNRMFGVIARETPDSPDHFLVIPANTIHLLNPDVVFDRERENLVCLKQAQGYLKIAHDAISRRNFEEAIKYFVKVQRLAPADSLSQETKFFIEHFTEILERRVSSLDEKVEYAEWKRQLVEDFRIWEKFIHVIPDYQPAKIHYKDTRILLDLVRGAEDAEWRGEIEYADRIWDDIYHLPLNFPIINQYKATKKRLDLVRQAKDAERTGPIEKAIPIWEEIIYLVPDYKFARNHYEAARRLKELVQKAEYAEQAGQLDVSIQIWEEIIHFAPDYEPAKYRFRAAKKELIERMHQEAEKKGQIDEGQKSQRHVKESHPINKEKPALEEAKRTRKKKKIKESKQKEPTKAEISTHKEIKIKQENIHVSLACPKLLSKRFTSTILVYLYPKHLSLEVRTNLREQLNQISKKEEMYRTTTYPTQVGMEAIVTVKIECPDIEFLSPTTVKIEDKINKVIFLAKPADTCKVGKHIAKLSIYEHDTDVEIFVIPFEIRVIDFVIDHISRPFVHKLATAITGLGALLLYFLTFFGQVDTTFGLASGTTVGLAAIAIYVQFNSLFQRLHSFPVTP